MSREIEMSSLMGKKITGRVLLVIGVMDLVDKVYSTFGLPYHLELSTRPKECIGTDEMWEAATAGLRGDLAYHQRVRALPAPDAVVDLRGHDGLLHAAGIHQPELAAAVEVVPGNLGQLGTRLAGRRLKRHHRHGNLVGRAADHLDFHRGARGKRRAEQSQTKEGKQQNGTQHGEGHRVHKRFLG